VCYLISKYLEDEWLGFYTLDQFTLGCTTLNADSIEKWAQVLNERLYPELENEPRLKELYMWCFDFAREEDKKVV